MKKLLVIILLTPFFVQSQEKADTLKFWKRSGVFAANFSQVSLTNWAAGGQSSMSGVFLMNYSANYKKDSLSWDNIFDFGYGFLKNNDEALRKSTDKIEFNSKVGYNTGTNWNYAGMVSFKSQFAPGYNYKNGLREGEPISKFLAPAYINLALGMDYKTEFMSLFLSPVTGKFTIVNDDVLSAAGEFGVDPGKSSGLKWGVA